MKDLGIGVTVKYTDQSRQTKSTLRYTCLPREDWFLQQVGTDSLAALLMFQLEVNVINHQIHVSTNCK